MLLTVNSDGSGNCTTISDALLRVADNPDSDRVIAIKPGIYREKLRIVTPGVTLIGQDPHTTIITFDDYAKKHLGDGSPMGTFNSYTLNVAASDVTLYNLSIVNSAGHGDIVGQAVALSADGDRFTCQNCLITGYQDTLYTGPMPSDPVPKGVNLQHPFAGFGEWNVNRSFRQYFNSCTIEGDVDFIFGSATAVFDRCTIKSQKRSSKESGYITAASTFPGERFGYVFLNCNVIGDADSGSVYLGRPWRINAKTLFIECYLGAHINASGWHDWEMPQAHSSTYYGEYNNHGPGAFIKKRPEWVKRLNSNEAAHYSTDQIFSGISHWEPPIMNSDPAYLKYLQCNR